MKLLALLLLYTVLPTATSHAMGFHRAPQHQVILTQDDLISETKKPGILYYHFQIPSTTNHTVISLETLERAARLAERKGCDLSVRIKIDGEKNVTMLLDKCGLISTTSYMLLKEQVIIVSPSYFTSLTNVGLQNCKGVEEPLLLHIYGDLNTSGTVSVNELQYPDSVKALLQDMAIRYTYPMLLIFIVIVFGCSCPRSFRCPSKPVVVECNGYRAWVDYPRRRIAYGQRGVSV